MDTTATRFEAITARLPPGYRAREFTDRDREPMVAERNAEVHELERGDADEWREWERIDPPKDLWRIVVEAPEGVPAASGEVGPGSFPRPDGSVHLRVAVARAHRGRGIGTALLDALEADARRRAAPRAFAGANVAIAGSLEWAEKRGYREIGRRIKSYVDVRAFDRSAFADAVERVIASGIRLVPIAELLAGRDADAREAFWRTLYEAETPMWEDVPWAEPVPHWPYEKFHTMMVESGKLVPEASIVALDGERIVGLTTTGRQRDRGYTWLTGTAREYRGRRIALALKVEMLRRAADAGLRAMLTANDEPNKAMRGINAKLGYVMLPADVELEKKL